MKTIETLTLLKSYYTEALFLTDWLFPGVQETAVPQHVLITNRDTTFTLLLKPSRTIAQIKSVELKFPVVILKVYMT